MPTTKDCQRLIFKIGLQCGISPKLIATRLLSEADKSDMVNGLLDERDLVTGVKVWIAAGCPDYAKGHTESLSYVEKERYGLV